MENLFKQPVISSCANLILLSSLGGLLSACGDSAPGTNHQVSGSVLGLEGTVVLQNASDDNVSISIDGDVTIAVDVPNGTNYNVQVVTQPDYQYCEVINGSGTVTSDINNIQVNCNRIHYFVATDTLHPAENYELWRSNGTNDGTYKVKEINLANVAGSSMEYDENIVEFNNAVYFTANNGTNGRELWKSDGTDGGTHMIIDLNLSTGNGSSNPGTFAVVNDQLLFNAFNESQGFTVLHNMNTNDEVSYLSYFPITDNHAVSGNNLFYEAWSSTAIDMVMYSTDGTTAGTKYFDSTYHTKPYWMTVIDDRVFAFRPNMSGGHSLFVANIDGNSAPTEIASFDDIVSNNISQSGQATNQIIVFDGKIFFNADDGVHGHTLWMSDGTASGTQMVKDLDDAVTDSEVFYLSVLNDKLAFIVTSGSARGLWITDGTEAGTEQLTSVSIITSSMAGESIPVVARIRNTDRLFFAAHDITHGRELWSSDGTAAGTAMVTDIYPGTNSGSPMRLIARNGYILFGAIESGEQGIELWRSDGTESGTSLVKDICTTDYCGGLAGTPRA